MGDGQNRQCLYNIKYEYLNKLLLALVLFTINYYCFSSPVVMHKAVISVNNLISVYNFAFDCNSV